MDQQKLIIIYIAVALVAVIVLVVVLSKKKKKEGFRKCICSEGQGGREENCQDTVTVNNLYVTNKLTEFSKLPDQDWTKVSPGDVNFPQSEGCAKHAKGWVGWDFTDFGS